MFEKRLGKSYYAFEHNGWKFMIRTGGAVSGGWWKGPNQGFEEGFMYINFADEDISWRYVDYGWDVKK